MNLQEDHVSKKLIFILDFFQNFQEKDTFFESVIDEQYSIKKILNSLITLIILNRI